MNGTLLEAFSYVAEDLLLQVQRQPHVLRVEVAGSVRRDKAAPKDLELVALVDSVGVQDDLFGGRSERPEPVLTVPNYLAGAYEPVKCGARYCQVRMPTIVYEDALCEVFGTPAGWPEVVNLDYFQTADPAEWGLLYFIRTGSADFVSRALAHWKRRTNGGYSQHNKLHHADGTVEPTPEEADVFRALGCKWVEPRDRKPKEN